MRVIAGELGGRRLVSPPGDEIRPTSDRAREALFSMLGETEGLAVLDLFCGTGALGIEALSRGAREATFVDLEVEVVRENVGTLGLADRAHLVRGDALVFLERAAVRFDLVLCDPPYGELAQLAPELVRVLPSAVAPGGRIVVESAARASIALDLIGFRLHRERRYGESTIRIWSNET